MAPYPTTTATRPGAPGAATPTPTVTAVPAVQGSYTVLWGDTLYSIAQRYGTTVEALAALNGLANPEFIYAGQRLLIPGSTQPPPPPTSIVYTVAPGDTLYSIAWRYGTTVETLVRLNAIGNPWFIYPGQRLIIPAGQAPETEVYVVKPGDTLISIALKYGTTVQALSMANRISNPWLIFVGQRLIIPARPSQQPSTYAVQPGDTLYAIAWRHGVEVEALAAVNGIRAPWVIYVGQLLVLP